MSLILKNNIAKKLNATYIMEREVFLFAFQFLFGSNPTSLFGLSSYHATKLIYFQKRKNRINHFSVLNAAK